MREGFIREKMRERVNEYSTHHPLSLHISTFNVNGKPPSERLFALIGRNPDGTDKTKQLPDIFVFGFQELDLSPEALLYLSTTEKEDSWCDAIFEDLGDAAEDYVKVTLTKSPVREMLSYRQTARLEATGRDAHLRPRAENPQTTHP